MAKQPFSLKVAGVKELNNALRDLIRGTPEEVSAQLYRLGEEIMDESKQLVPVDTGALRSSGVVLGPTQETNGSEVTITVTLGYGGPGINYAIPVHEIPPPPAQSVGGRSATHPVGMWKYLEVPVLSRALVMTATLRHAIEDFLKKSTK